MSYQRPFRDGTLNFTPYLTYLLAAAAIALTISYWLTGSKDGTFGAVRLEQIWSGEYGGLITPTLLHGSILHLLFNVMWLTRIGPLVERAMGRLEYGVFIALSAIAGTATEILVTSHDAIGLSGVVYALWGVCWAARRSVTAFQIVTTREVTNWMVGWLILCIILTQTGYMHVANGAHVGGLLFGVAVGWLFLAPETPKRFKATGVAFLATLIAATVLSVTYVPWSERWQWWKATPPALVNPRPE